MEISLRNYCAADFEVLYEIDQQCFDPALAYSRPDLRNYLRLPGGDCVIAEASDDVAGFLVTAHERATGLPPPGRGHAPARGIRAPLGRC
jgi:hypothetical protein